MYRAGCTVGLKLSTGHELVKPGHFPAFGKMLADEVIE